MTKTVSEKDAFEQFQKDVKYALQMLDCYGSADEIIYFTNALQKYRMSINLKPEMCAHERPPRKVICQLPKGHAGSHHAVIFWEDK